MKGRRLVIGFLYLVGGALQALVLMRVALQMLGALAEEPLPHLVFRLSDPLLSPLSSMHPLWQSGDRELESGSLLALVAIFVFVYVGVRLLRIQVVKATMENR